MSGASFFQEFQLDQTTTQSVETMLASVQAMHAEVRAIRDELASSVTGDLTGADVARLLTARDEAVGAANTVEGIAASVNDAAVAVGNAATAASGYRAGAAASEAAAVSAALQAQANATTTSSRASDALTAAGEARVQADRADAFANSPPGFEVEPGRYGLPHYYERVRTAVDSGGAFEVVPHATGDADMAGNKYVLKPEDLGKLHIFEVSAETEIELPVDVWTQRTPDGGHTEAWVRIRRHAASTADLVFVSPSSAEVQTVAPLAHAVFTYGVEPPVTSPAISRTFTVPPGVDREASFIMQASFLSSKVGRNSTLTVSGSTGLTKVNETSELSHSTTDPIDVAVWTANLGTSAVATNHTLVLTPDGNPTAAVLVADAVINSVGVVQAPVYSNLNLGASGEVAIAVNPDTDKGMVVAVTGHRGGDARPLTPVSPSGTENPDNTKTPLNRNLKDISFVTHRHQNVVTGSRTYKSTSGKVDRGSGVALVFKPDVSTTVSTTLNGSDTVSGDGESCTLMVSSDGKTYHRDA